MAWVFLSRKYDLVKNDRLIKRVFPMPHTAISIKVVPEESGKVEYELKKPAGSDD